MRVALTIGVLGLTMALSSCFKKELPVPAHDPGDVTVTEVNMDASYKWQLYYKLATNSIVGKNLKTEWDLGFEATAGGYHVVLNSAKSMTVMRTAKKDMSSVTKADTAGFSVNKKYDSPGGSMDSTVVDDWRNDGYVYIIDRGFDEMGRPMGIEKVIFNTVSATEYTLTIAKLTETTGTLVKVKKDTAYNLTFLSFDDGGKAVMIEPPKKDWDLTFTQYTHIFYDLATPYLVTGCLLNRTNTCAYLDTAFDFSQLSYASVSNDKLSSQINAIGYEWKSFNGTKYTTNPRMNYLIRDQSGIYYKLHFTDFYSTAGIKGNPKWEYQRL